MSGTEQPGMLQARFSRSLVDEWARCGVGVAALAPGSRSTPLALALAADERLRLEVFLDERSAAFFALGAAKASGRPSIVLCTSGTAAANFYPAVLEARHARVPLVVCTADRPPELRDTGAGQTADQIKLYGDAVRWFCEVGVADDRAAERALATAYWRSIACRVVAEASGPPSGPVHLNLAFRDPLVATSEADAGAPAAAAGVGAETEPEPEPGGRAGGRPWVASSAGPPMPRLADVDRLAEAVSTTTRGLVVAGWGAGATGDTVERFAEAAGWPVLADPISGARQGRGAISIYDAVLRSPVMAESLRADLVVQLGAPLTGKVATRWLDGTSRRVIVDPDGAWLDPHRGASERIVADPESLLAAVAYRLGSTGPGTGGGSGRGGSGGGTGGGGPVDRSWLERWWATEAAAREATDALLDSRDEPSEPRTARDLVAHLPDGWTIVVGSSMPVRDVEAFARPRKGLRFLSNRGVNGIDGFVSTVLGVAASAQQGGGRPVAALCGDLTFLHDAGGLLGASRRGLDATFVVVDNRGGGIFSFLPQAEHPEHYEKLFGTPHDVDLAEVCAVHHVTARRIDRASELAAAVDAAIAEGGLQVVIVPTDRAANVAHHRRLQHAVGEAVSGSTESS